MAKRTDTKIAVLVQVMDELGFDREIIAKVSHAPQRTVSEIVNRRGYWVTAGEFNELRETYRFLSEKAHQRRSRGAWPCGFEAIRGTKRKTRIS